MEMLSAEVLDGVPSKFLLRLSRLTPANEMSP